MGDLTRGLTLNAWDSTTFFRRVEKWHFQKSFENALEKKVYRASYMDHIHVVKNKKWICNVYQMNLELLTLKTDYQIIYFDVKWWTWIWMLKNKDRMYNDGNMQNKVVAHYDVHKRSKIYMYINYLKYHKLKYHLFWFLKFTLAELGFFNQIKL